MTELAQGAASLSILQELAQSAGWYRAIADGARDWEFLLGPGRQFLYTSPACQRISGHHPADFRVSPSLFVEIAHPDDRQALSAALERGLGQECEPGLDYRLVDAAGRERRVQLAFQPAYDESGAFLGVRGSVRSIDAMLAGAVPPGGSAPDAPPTPGQPEGSPNAAPGSTDGGGRGLKAANGRPLGRRAFGTAQGPDLASSAAYHGLALQSISDAVVITDPSSRVTAANRAAQQLFGWRLPDVLGRRTADLIQAEFLSVPRAAAYAILSNDGRWEGEIRVILPDGMPRTMATEFLAVRDADGAVTGFVGIYRDLTERMRTAAALRLQSERLAILREIDRAALSIHSAAEIAQVGVRSLRRALACDCTSVMLFDVAREMGTVVAEDSVADLPVDPTSIPLKRVVALEDLRAGRNWLVSDIAALPSPSPIERALLARGIRCYISLPLVSAGEGSQAMPSLIGELTLCSSFPAHFTAEEVDLARQVADSLAVALHNASLFEKLTLSHARVQHLVRRLVQVQEDERKAIARELHDEAGQSLTALAIGLTLVLQECEAPESIAPRIDSLRQMVNDIMESLHRLSADLRPAALDRAGLPATLHQYAATFSERSELAVEVATVGLDREGERLAPEVEICLYRIVQEALTNVARHARASHADVVVQRCPVAWVGGESERVILTIEDDGIGFDVDDAARRGRLGLLGMQERVAALGGLLEIESAPGAGTTIWVEIPL